MTGKEITLSSLNHTDPGIIPVDLGGTGVTGIHVRAIENLRKYYGIFTGPVKVIEPYQMLGEVEEDLAEILGVHVYGIVSRKNMFGIPQDEGWKELRTFWGQTVLVPDKFNTKPDSDGSLLIFPEGDTSVPPCAKMPKEGFFFDAIVRQEPIVENKLKPEDNLEEFSLIGDEDLQYWKKSFDKARNTGKAVIAGFGGTAIGDIALVPAMNLKHPKGIRDIAEWYMSTVMRSDLLHQVFEKQTDIAIQNMARIYANGGDAVDVVFICGTDFGTQISTFISPQAFDGLYAPYYKKMNNWIHEKTNWKTFKHSCGAVEPFISKFIECGFDILNPVQISAAGMDPESIKNRYGKEIVFWGGGVDTQKVLAFGTPDDVREQVIANCRIFRKDGGFVFNTVHNIQANVPVENIVAMVETVKKINS
jgi:uroporphyrinogen-III decarboxylase